MTAHIVWDWAADCSRLVVLRQQRSCLQNWINLDVPRIIPKMLRIHYLVSISLLTECRGYCEYNLEPYKTLPQTVRATPRWADLATVTAEDWIPWFLPVSGDTRMPGHGGSAPQQDHTAPGSSLNCGSPCTACNLQTNSSNDSCSNIKTYSSNGLGSPCLASISNFGLVWPWPLTSCIPVVTHWVTSLFRLVFHWVELLCILTGIKE